VKMRLNFVQAYSILLPHSYSGPDENSRMELYFSVEWNRIIVKGWTNCESRELKYGFYEHQIGMLLQKLSSNDRSVLFQRLMT